MTDKSWISSQGPFPPRRPPAASGESGGSRHLREPTPRTGSTALCSSSPGRWSQREPEPQRGGGERPVCPSRAPSPAPSLLTGRFLPAGAEQPAGRQAPARTFRKQGQRPSGRPARPAGHSRGRQQRRTEESGANGPPSLVPVTSPRGQQTGQSDAREAGARRPGSRGEACRPRPPRGRTGTPSAGATGTA